MIGLYALVSMTLNGFNVLVREREWAGSAKATSRGDL